MPETLFEKAKLTLTLPPPKNEMTKMPSKNTKPKLAETNDLRPPLLYKNDPAFLLAYAATSASQDNQQQKSNGGPHDQDTGFSLKESNALKKGAMKKFHKFAYKAFEMDRHLNTLVSARLNALFGDIIDPKKGLNLYEVVKRFIKQLRKWLTRETRNLSVVYIWVRELVAHEGEHLHLALHLPKKHRKPFLRFLERSLGEPLATQKRSAPRKTKGEIACSRDENWHVAVEVPGKTPEFQGYWLASYLGKGEPSERLFRGKLVDNIQKPERGQAFGGRLKHSRYDAPQGVIQGNYARIGRIGISRSLTA